MPMKAGSRRLGVRTAGLGLGALIWAVPWLRGVGEQAGPVQLVLDGAVGMAFLAAAATASRPISERTLFGGVAFAWVAGALVPAALLLHQAVLLVALAASLGGARHRRSFWSVTVLAVPVAFGWLPQLVVASLFAATAVRRLAVEAADRTAASFPSLGAAAVAVTLAASWVASTYRLPVLDPATALLGYHLVLILVALVFPLAARTLLRKRARLADKFLTGPALPGLQGLSAVLRLALGDPSLTVHRRDGDSYVDDRGQRVSPHPDWLFVDDGHGPIAVVAPGSAVLQDPPTAAAVAEAVRLTVTHLRLQDTHRQRLHELEAARLRILNAADRTRSLTAAELRQNVGAPLDRTRADLDRLRRSLPDDPRRILDVVVGELDEVAKDITGVVAGVPPVELGWGRLGDAVRALAERTHLSVSVTVGPETAAEPSTEAALYYVVSEALTNAAKHAAATHAHVSLTRQGGVIEVVVADYGRGGADPRGSGLQGLADRLFAHGGRLRVTSPPGAGTTVVATVPIR